MAGGSSLGCISPSAAALRGCIRHSDALRTLSQSQAKGEAHERCTGRREGGIGEDRSSGRVGVDKFLSFFSFSCAAAAAVRPGMYNRCTEGGGYSLLLSLCERSLVLEQSPWSPTRRLASALAKFCPFPVARARSLSICSVSFSAA